MDEMAQMDSYCAELIDGFLHGTRYRRKPLTVVAEQFFPDKPWPKNVIQKQDGYYLDTHGPYRVWEGYWVVTKENGRQETYSPEDFEELFEKDG